MDNLSTGIPALPVSIAGGFWTGSGALVDLLHEHPDCAIVPNEFTLFSYGQFFDEVTRPYILRSKRKQSYLQNLVRYQEFNRKEPPYVFSAIRLVCSKMNIFPTRLFYHRLGMGRLLGADYIKSCRNLYQLLSAPEHQSAEELEARIADVLRTAYQSLPNGPACKAAVFDQMVAAPYTEQAQEAIPPLKLINVDRNWRDQYVEVRNQIPRMAQAKKRIGIRPWGADASELGAAPVPFFIKLRKLIDKTKQSHATNQPNSVLWLNFEDIVQDTDQSAERVFKFLELDLSKWNKGTKLFPERSIKNIGKWKNSPYLDEIDIIEEAIESSSKANHA